MPESHLVTHCGARVVTPDELACVPAPPPTETWFPIKHGDVVTEVTAALTDGGFTVRKANYALSRNDARLFATLDLESGLGHGTTLAVGIRNSTDKSLPLGFCAGSRVFVCDNLAFRSELLVTRKHTKFGSERFREAICLAVKSLAQFKETEQERIRRFVNTSISDERAESFMLRAFEQGVVSHRLLPEVIREYRNPSFEEFQDRTLWSLFNAFTTALGSVQKTNPQRFASATMQLQGLIDSRPEFTVAV